MLYFFLLEIMLYFIIENAEYNNWKMRRDEMTKLRKNCNYIYVSEIHLNETQRQTDKAFSDQPNIQCLLCYRHVT